MGGCDGSAVADGVGASTTIDEGIGVGRNQDVVTRAANQDVVTRAATDRFSCVTTGAGVSRRAATDGEGFCLAGKVHGGIREVG